MKIQTKVTPWLSFASQALEAAEFYVSMIPDSNIDRVTMNPATETPIVVDFVLGGLPVCSLNTGEDFGFTNAFSFSVACENQAEIDHLWSHLCAGGKEIQCGWLNDRFGVAWQIVPAKIMDYWNTGEPEKMKRMMDAMMKMIKLDIAELDAAFHG
jgi:predicted 3-demethylubiquinone-9 3-methyltransferase (glyoxalase superfamily)